MFGATDSAGGVPAVSIPVAPMAGTRDRWRMGPEARALVVVTAALTAFGLAVLYSASAIVAINAGSPGHFFVVRQAVGVLVGMLAFAVAAKVDAERWNAWAWPIMLVSLVLMVVIILPGTEFLSKRVGGSRRYLYGGSIQPSELAKFAVIVWVPMLLVKKGDAVKRLGKGLLPFVVVIGALTMLAILEPDYSVAGMFCLLMAVLLFAGGARVAHFVFLAALLVPVAAQQVAQRGYLRARVESYLRPDTSASGASKIADQQQYQSMVAVGSGGISGVGFGQGNQQRGWLPLAYNDFVGSVVGEEFGFLGIAAMVLAFTAYGWLGFRIAKNARTPFQSLMAIGLTFATVFTAFIHIGVVLLLLPNTGLTLPFVSYGRSNLLLTLAMTGILVNIGSERERVYGWSATDPLVGQAR
jgi:cell division protein FtsW